MKSALPSRREAIVLGGASLLFAMLEQAGLGSNSPRAETIDDLRLRIGANSRKLIWVWPEGGPSQLDTFDMKPDAPAGIRSPFTAVSKPNGLFISDQFPELGGLADQITWIRSRVGDSLLHSSAINQVLLHHRGNGHNFLTRVAEPSQMHQVYGQTPQVYSFPELRRSFGADKSDEMHWNAGCFALPQVYALSQGFDRPVGLQGALRPPAFSSDQTRQHDEMVRRSHEVIRRGSRVEPETAADVRRYCGDRPDNSIGRGMLTISRLARAGLHKVFFLRFGQWDTHWDLERDIRQQAAPADRALAALARDVISGRLGDTLLVYAGEFGRTPEIALHPYGNNPGREHGAIHTNFMVSSNPLSLRRGLVYGRTNALCSAVEENPVSNRDWLLTIAEALAQRPNAAARRDLPRVFV